MNWTDLIKKEPLFPIGVKAKVEQLKEDIKFLKTMMNKPHYKENIGEVKDLIKRAEKFLEEITNETDTFEKEAGGVSFGGHGANPELFNIRYGKKKRDKNAN